MLDLSDLIITGICIGALIVSWLKDQQKTKDALRYTVKSLSMFLPLFIAIFALIGIFNHFISKNLIVSILGSSKGFLAPVYAAFLGGILGGPPPIAYPICKYLLDQHASISSAATFIVAWSAVGTITLPIQIKYLGRKLALTQWATMILFSIVIGIITGWLL